jgi:hypothetical protein
MHLYAVGDSHTHGDELAEDPATGICIDHAYRLANSWPGRFAALHGIEFTNEGRGGSSNDYSLRKMMKFTSTWLANGKNPADLLVIIGWTHSNRREFYKPDDRYGEEYKFRNFLVPSSPERRVDFAKRASAEETAFFNLYEQHFFTEEHSITLTLQNQLSAQCYLKQAKIPYLFFNCAWSPDATLSPSGHLANLIDTRRFYGFNEYQLTFSRWARNNGYPRRNPRGHPDEVAHNAWAQNLLDYISQNGLLQPD